VAATGPADTAQPFSFPAVVLVVSGGHTELILMKDFGQYRLLGATLDDAAGEAFDKVSKMLELGYPGGPVVSKRAALGRPDAFTLPRPMLNTPNFDFSFSGLKTAVLQVVKRKESWTDAEINDLCASFQAAVIETLVVKTIRTVREHDARTVFLAGGVAANKTLRETLKSAVESQTDAMCVLPELAYTTDNAAMIAMAGYFRFRAGQRDDIFNFMPDPNWELGRS
jgi:N6-L-threonylcarbamoyladenine synthase